MTEEEDSEQLWGVAGGDADNDKEGGVVVPDADEGGRGHTEHVDGEEEVMGTDEGVVAEDTEHVDTLQEDEYAEDEGASILAQMKEEYLRSSFGEDAPVDELPKLPTLGEVLVFDGIEIVVTSEPEVDDDPEFAVPVNFMGRMVNSDEDVHVRAFYYLSQTKLDKMYPGMNDVSTEDLGDELAREQGGDLLKRNATSIFRRSLISRRNNVSGDHDPDEKNHIKFKKVVHGVISAFQSSSVWTQRVVAVDQKVLGRDVFGKSFPACISIWRCSLGHCCADPFFSTPVSLRQTCLCSPRS